MEDQEIRDNQYEIKITTVKSASYFYGYKVPLQYINKSIVDEIGRFMPNSSYSAGPGTFVGVYLPEVNQWVRGIIKSTIIRSKLEDCCFKILLIDLGEYRTVTRTYVYDLPGKYHSAPTFLKIALDGVIASGPWTDKEKDRFTNGLLNKGTLTFHERTCKNNIHFGEIYVKVPLDDGYVDIVVRKVLLKKGYVKTVDNFVEDFEKYIEESVSDVDIPTPKVKQESGTEKLEERTDKETSSSKTSAQESPSKKFNTPRLNQYEGSSSDDERYSGPHKTATYIPAGYNLEPKKESKSLKVRPKPIGTHYQIENDRRRSKSEGRPPRKMSSERPHGRYSDQGPRNVESGRRYEADALVDKPVSVSTPPAQKPRVSFGPTCTVNEPAPPKRGFKFHNKNLKSALKMDRSDASSGDEWKSISSGDLKSDDGREKVSAPCGMGAPPIVSPVLSENSIVGNSPVTESNMSVLNSSGCSLNTSFMSNQSAYFSANSSVGEHQSSSTVTRPSRFDLIKQYMAEKSKSNLDLSVKSGSNLSETSKSFSSLNLLSENSISGKSPVNTASNMSGLNSSESSFNLSALSNQSANFLDKTSVPEHQGSSTVTRLSRFDLFKQMAEKSKSNSSGNLSVKSDIDVNDTPKSFKVTVPDDDLSSPNKLGWRTSNDEGATRKEADYWHKMDQLMLSEEVDDVTEPVAFGSTSVLTIANAAVGLLVHSASNKEVPKISSLDEANLNPDVVKEYERYNLRELAKIQQVGIPAIRDGHNMTLISPPVSGKTTAFILPLASLLLDTNSYPNQDREYGPRAIVLTPCWDSGHTVANRFEKLSRKLFILQTHGGGAEEEKKDLLLTRPDVLVSTPCSLERLLKLRYTTLDNLYHLILDDSDVLLEKFNSQISELIKQVAAVEFTRRNKTGVQVVATASKWTPVVAELTNCLDDVTLVMASAMEASLYAEIKPTLKICHQEIKHDSLARLLGGLNNEKRTLIMCKSKEDVAKLYFMLKNELGLSYVLAAHEDISSIRLSEMPQLWNKEFDDRIKQGLKNESIDELWALPSKTRPIMVRSDPVLDEYPIRNAEVLIHYNMPANLTTFSLRFSSIIDNFPNKLKQEKWDEKEKPKVYIFLDDQNTIQFPEVINYLRRIGTQLPESFEAEIKIVEESIEREKVHFPLCKDLKKFGKCQSKKTCYGRHVVCPELDQPTNVPKSGKVKILIQHVSDVCCFHARIIEHSPEEGVWNKMSASGNVALFTARINNFYSKEENRRAHGSPSVGDIAAVEVAPNEYRRVTVLTIAKLNERKEAETVHLRYIDEGKICYHVKILKLLSLPDELAKPPGTSVEVYLCGLAPRDLDMNWSDAARQRVRDILQDGRRNHPEAFLCGQIVLSLGHCMWLEPLEFKEYMPIMKTEISYYSFQRKFLDEKFAVKNPDHMKILYSMCESAKLDIGNAREDYEAAQLVPATPKPVQVKPQWAWLPRDELESVHVVTVHSPSVIFVRISSFVDCLTSLEKDIEDHMRVRKNEDDLSLILDVGDVCLGKSPGQEQWNRAVIKSKSEEGLEVFFADYGDFASLTWSEVASIPNSLISQLPFQAVECSLAGIRYTESDDPDWEEDLIDQIYDHSRNADEVAIELQVQVCDVESQGTITGGRRYIVILGDSSGTINDKLLSERIIKDDLCMSLIKQSSRLESDQDSDETVVGEEAEEKRKVKSKDIEIISTVQTKDGIEQFYTEDFDPKKPVTSSEKEFRVWQFLKDVYDGKFEYSAYPMDEDRQPLDNDADVSDSEDDNQSEASGFSVPQSRRPLPQLTAAPISNEKNVLVQSCLGEIADSLSSHSIVSSSLNEMNDGDKKYDATDTEHCEVLNQDYLDLTAANRSELLSHCNKGEAVNTFINSKKEILDNNECNVMNPNGSFGSSCVMNFAGVINPSGANVVGKTSPLGIKIYTHEKAYPLSRISPCTSSSPNSLSYTFADIISPTLKATSFHMETDNETDLDEYVKKEDVAHDRSIETCAVPTSSSSNIKEHAVAHCSRNVPSKEGNQCKENENSKIQSKNSNGLQSEAKSSTLPVKQEISDQNNRWVVQKLLLDTDEVLSDVSPAGSTNEEYRIPSVEWYQDKDFVWIHIMLSGLTQNQVHIKYDVSSVDFRANCQGVPFRLNLQLKGAHIYQEASSGPRAFHYEIKLVKVLKGKRFNWPRLVKSSEKLHWLKYNIEKWNENMEESEDEDIRKYAETLRKNTECDETLSTCSESSDYACSELSEYFDPLLL